jgi:hypothetical protein
MKRAKKGAPDGKAARSNKSLYLMLTGVVIGGIVGWWRWLRSVRKY